MCHIRLTERRMKKVGRSRRSVGTRPQCGNTLHPSSANCPTGPCGAPGSDDRWQSCMHKATLVSTRTPLSGEEYHRSVERRKWAEGSDHGFDLSIPVDHYRRSLRQLETCTDTVILTAEPTDSPSVYGKRGLCTPAEGRDSQSRLQCKPREQTRRRREKSSRPSKRILSCKRYGEMGLRTAH